MGYCPQFDALYNELTAREHLLFYGSLLGYTLNDRNQMAQLLLQSMNLDFYADQLVATFSVGTKRKLSTTIAMMGDPSILLLDEPTTGMDPCSRRFLWHVVRTLVNDGKSVIFTSHSMEECESLCSRLAVMVNGRLRCLGSAVHLRNKFGDGYTLRMRICDHSEKRRNAIIEFIQRHLSTAQLKEHHFSYVQFGLPSTVDLCSLFRLAHEMQMDDGMGVQGCSISQNNLDDVFVNFVREQGTMEHVAKV